MGVRDVLTLAQKAVILVNSDVAASQQVADRFCAMYGIPTANQFTYAMGTNVLWEFTSERFGSFWTDLYAKVQSVGAYAVLSTAGCPVGIEVPDQDGVEGINGDGLNFALLIGLVKRIYAAGKEPRLYLSPGIGYYPMVGPSYTDYLIDTGASHKPNQVQDSAAINALLQLGADPLLTAAGSTTQEYYFTTYRSASPNFSTVDNLLTGHIGYYTQSEATHPSDLWDRSRILLGKAGNLQIPASQQSARRVLVCPETLNSSAYCHDSKQALIGKKLQTLGLDVKYWYPGTPSAAAEALLPVASEYNWTTGQLDAGTASPTCTFTLAVGCGFENLKDPTWKSTMIPSTSGGVMCCGKSDGDQWGKTGMVDAGHSYIEHARIYNWHQGATQQGKVADIWLNLIAGRTLAEAAWCSLEGTFLAVGDPLCRLFP